jgi:hypothetical protein
MFPQPFQNMTANDVRVALGWLIGSWVFLGIPSVFAVFAVRFLSRRLRIHRLGFYKYLVFRPILLSLPLLALLFGLAAGYFEASTYIDCYQPGHQEKWYEVLGITGAPGDLIANAYRGDWQDDEAWDYRSEIAIWNGLFWLGVAGMAAFWIQVNNRARHLERYLVETGHVISPKSIPAGNQPQ